MQELSTVTETNKQTPTRDCGCWFWCGPGPIPCWGLISPSGKWTLPGLGPWAWPGPDIGPGPPGPIALGPESGPIPGLGPCSDWGPLTGGGPLGPKSPAPGPCGKAPSGRGGPCWGTGIRGPGISGLGRPGCGPLIGGGPVMGYGTKISFECFKFQYERWKEKWSNIYLFPVDLSHKPIVRVTRHLRGTPVGLKML